MLKGMEHMERHDIASLILDRAQDRLLESLNQMTVEEANTMPKPLIKSVTWLVWHTARMIDLQISSLKGESPLWTSKSWTDRFDLDLPDDTPDYKHSPQEAEKVKVEDKRLLTDYLSESIDLAKDYLGKIDPASLDEVIDRSYTPPVTRLTRLISIVDDADMHSGQAVYTRRLVLGK